MIPAFCTKTTNTIAKQNNNGNNGKDQALLQPLWVINHEAHLLKTEFTSQPNCWNTPCIILAAFVTQ